MVLRQVIDKSLLKARKETINRSMDIWQDSFFNFLLPLSSDERGHYGENYFQELMKEHTNYLVVWDGDNNTSADDGIYDMKLNLLRTELKTAMKGTKTDSWQHDVIKEVDDYDRLVFIDMIPDNKVYFTIIKNTDMVYGTRHPIFQKKSSQCKGGWKFDSSNATLKKGMNAGLTYLHDTKNPNDVEFSKFLVRHFA